MTALDQAFIRAYSQQDPVSPSISLEPVQRVPLDDTLLDPVSGKSSAGGADASAGEMAQAVAEALAEPPAHAPASETRTLEADQVEEESVVPEVPGTDNLVALLGTVPAGGGFLKHRVDTAHNVASPGAEAVLKSAPGGEFLPRLRVKHFLWPEECLRIIRQAPDQLTLLADSLARQSAGGQGVVGFGGHAAGEGSTTILLAAAKSLAGSGMKTIIVDADIGNPCLDERLGIACRIGWDEVLDAGEPLEEAAIESHCDRLTLLPLRRTSSDENHGPDRYVDQGTALQRVRGHYDLILVDLGKLDPEIFAGDAPGGRPIKECIDALVLVQDVRNGARAELDQARRLLHQADVVELGLIENFV